MDSCADFLRSAWKTAVGGVRTLSWRSFWVWAYIFCGIVFAALTAGFGGVFGLFFAGFSMILMILWLLLKAILFLMLGYLLPPRPSMALQSALVFRVNQLCRIVFGALMLGIGAYWGALLSVDVQRASILQDPGPRLTGLAMTGIHWPAMLAFFFGLLYVVGALAVDVVRASEVERRGCVERALRPLGGVVCDRVRRRLADYWMSALRGRANIMAGFFGAVIMLFLMMLIVLSWAPVVLECFLDIMSNPDRLQAFSF
ncbi:hypothetical protein [Actinomyces slackii]|nr:hypothetical protein [Actinomyces slackii]